MMTKATVRELGSEELAAEPVDEQVDRSVEDSNATAEELVALESRAPVTSVASDPRGIRSSLDDVPAWVAACLAMAAVSGVIISFTSWLPQPVVAAVLTMSACFFTHRLCSKLRPEPMKWSEDSPVVPADPAREWQSQEPQETSFMALAKLRARFESLFEEHVFINEELREREAEVDHLKSRLEQVDAPPDSEAMEPDNQETVEVTSRPAELIRIWSEPLTPGRRDVTMREQLKMVVDRFRPKAKKRGVKLSARVSKDVGVVPLDPMMLDRIVEELLGNAVKYTKKGGSITLSASLRRGSGDNPFCVRINVKDSGPGIPSTDQEHLFSAGAADKGSESGDQLGLPIAHGYTQLLGGEISVNSSPRKGSVFTVELPVKRNRLE